MKKKIIMYVMAAFIIGNVAGVAIARSDVLYQRADKEAKKICKIAADIYRRMSHSYEGIVRTEEEYEGECRVQLIRYFIEKYKQEKND